MTACETNITYIAQVTLKFMNKAPILFHHSLDNDRSTVETSCFTVSFYRYEYKNVKILNWQAVTSDRLDRFGISLKSNDRNTIKFNQQDPRVDIKISGEEKTEFQVKFTALQQLLAKYIVLQRKYSKLICSYRCSRCWINTFWYQEAVKTVIRPILCMSPFTKVRSIY